MSKTREQLYFVQFSCRFILLILSFLSFLHTRTQSSFICILMSNAICGVKHNNNNPRKLGAFSKYNNFVELLLIGTRFGMRIIENMN